MSDWQHILHPLSVTQALFIHVLHCHIACAPYLLLVHRSHTLHLFVLETRAAKTSDIYEENSRHLRGNNRHLRGKQQTFTREKSDIYEENNIHLRWKGSVIWNQQQPAYFMCDSQKQNGGWLLWLVKLKIIWPM